MQILSLVSPPRRIGPASDASTRRPDRPESAGLLSARCPSGSRIPGALPGHTATRNRVVASSAFGRRRVRRAGCQRTSALCADLMGEDMYALAMPRLPAP